jgi:Cu/Zn superoxide dismutase
MRKGMLSLMVISLLSLALPVLLAQDTSEVMGGSAMASLQTADGQEAGTVTFAEQDGALIVSGLFMNLTPGFHGFHLHDMGSCEDSGEGPFSAAGHHLNPDGANHPEHAAGDGRRHRLDQLRHGSRDDGGSV